MLKAFISHSSKQKEFATKLVELLGRDRCIIDCYNFESAYKTIEEIYSAIDNSTIFVLLISEDSLSSSWVLEEVRYKREKLKNSKGERFWPFIIDKNIGIDDCPEWMVRDESFNLKKFDSPYVLARDINQKFRKLIWTVNPRLKMLETTMIGRNDDIDKFEEKWLSAQGMQLRCLIISGRIGVGKETFARQCLMKVGFPLEIEPYRINLDAKDNIEDFILGLNMIANEQLFECFSGTLAEKVQIAVKLLNKLYETRSVVFVEDNMVCVSPRREIPQWFIDILRDSSLNSQLGLYVFSNLAPNAYIENSYNFLAHIPLKPLERKDRYKLFYSLVREYNLQNITEDDAWFFVDKLLQSPSQIFQAVETIRTHSLSIAKKDIEFLIKAADKKIRPLLEHYNNEDSQSLLIILSRFDFVSYEILEEIFEERIKEAMEIISDMMIYGIVFSFGPSENYFRLDSYVSDYIRRNRFKLPNDLEFHVNEVLENKIRNADDINEDTSLYLYSIKQRIIRGKATDHDYLIPSVVIKTVMDTYNRQDYNLVVTICDKVFNSPYNYYPEIIYELIYWQCLAFCRLQNEVRFYENVKKIKKRNGTEYLFLMGFYKRLRKKYEEAEKYQKQVLKSNPNMKRAKRELVAILMAQHLYGEALSLAEDNYRYDSDNTYHIHAYFRCLVKKATTYKEINIIEQLIKSIKNSFSYKRDELVASMNIEYQAYIMRASPMEMIKLISDYEAQYPYSNDVKRAANEYKYKYELIAQLENFEEDV